MWDIDLFSIILSWTSEEKNQGKSETDKAARNEQDDH